MTGQPIIEPCAPGEPARCATCGSVLVGQTLRGLPQVVEYLHVHTEDHAPVPIPARLMPERDQRHRCDFCSATTVDYSSPARTSRCRRAPEPRP